MADEIKPTFVAYIPPAQRRQTMYVCQILVELAESNKGV